MPVPDTQPVLILTGAPGVGKTTTGRLLAAGAPRSVHLESDRFFDFIAAGFVEPWKPESHPQNTVVMQVVAEAAARYAGAGFFTVVDGIVIPRWFLEPLRASLGAAGFPVALAVLRAPLAVCLSRARERGWSGLADDGVIERIWREFDDLGALEDHVIDAAGNEPERLAELISERLDGDLLLREAGAPEPR
jgi:predicted kinase